MGEREIAGRYVLAEPIGRGGMGVVWRAYDRTLKRTVALKEVLPPASMNSDEAQSRYRRLEREAQIAGRLSHPGIVTVHDVFTDEDGLPWIVMQYIPSLSLHDLIASQGPLTALRAGRIGQQLLDALAAAHDEGVLHRDVNPRNVLIAPGRAGDRLGGRPDERAVLTDFGIALFEGDTRLTQADQMFHTTGFTAPERYEGDNATAASDLWSLGATVFAAVEGHGPFTRETGIATMAAVMRDPAPPATSAGPLLGRLIAALLDREPSARPSAAAAASMLAENLPLMAGEAGQLSFLTTASPYPAPATEPALEAGPPLEAGPGDTQRAGSHQPVLPAPFAPTAVSEPPPLRVRDQPGPPDSVPRAPSDPRSAGGLLQEFDREAGGSAPAARRVRTRRFARKSVLTIAGSLGAAVIAVAVLVLAHYQYGPTTPRSTAAANAANAAKTSTAASAAGSSRLPPTAGAPAIVEAIDTPYMKDPAGYTYRNFFAAQLGTKAGFTIGWPQGWSSSLRGQTVFLRDGLQSVMIDLSTHVQSSMIAEAEYLAARDHADYPGYQRIYGGSGQSLKKFFQAEDILGTPGALWEFDWAGHGVPMRMDVLLFNLGPQSYTIYMTGPAGPYDREWNKHTLPIVSAMLHSFDDLPAAT